MAKITYEEKQQIIEILGDRVEGYCVYPNVEEIKFMGGSDNSFFRNMVNDDCISINKFVYLFKAIKKQKIIDMANSVETSVIPLTVGEKVSIEVKIVESSRVNVKSYYQDWGRNTYEKKTLIEGVYAGQKLTFYGTKKVNKLEVGKIYKITGKVKSISEKWGIRLFYVSKAVDMGAGLLQRTIELSTTETKMPSLKINTDYSILI